MPINAASRAISGERRCGLDRRGHGVLSGPVGWAEVGPAAMTKTWRGASSRRQRYLLQLAVSIA
jgi:hypothetical protein